MLALVLSIAAVLAIAVPIGFGFMTSINGVLPATSDIDPDIHFLEVPAITQGKR